MIKLSSTQLKHYEALMWLFDNLENLRVGRSTLIAHVLIKLAMKYPKREIHISDIHTLPLFGNNPMINRNFLNNTLVPMLKGLQGFSYNKSRNTIIYEK